MTHSIKAKILPNRMITMVWFIPLLAMVIGAWMLIQDIRAKGPEITIHMPSADGIEVNKTVVKVLSVDVGRVTSINLDKDRTGVVVKARVNSESKNLLREDTKFWVVKPRIDQGGIQGLGTLLSGAYIEFSPGTTGKEKREFNMLSAPPITSSQQQGLRIQLQSEAGKIIPVGNPVLYHDIPVGRIEKAEFVSNSQNVHYQIFIDKPHDTLVNSNTHFWITSGIDIRTVPEGIKIRSGSLSTLLGGGISFDIKPGSIPGKPIEQNATFTLFSDIDQMEQVPSVRALYYVVFFNQSIRGLAVNSPVEYKGIRVGSVVQVPFYDKDHGLKILQEDSIPVLIRIDPERIEFNVSNQEKSYWENEMQAAIKKGLTAKLQSNSLIMGGLFVNLSMEKNPVVSGHSIYAGHSVIPSMSGGLDQLQDQLSALLDKLNKLPLENTVKELNSVLREVRQLSGSLNKIAASPDTQRIPKELNQTMKELQKTLQGISPNSPLYGEAQNTIKSLNKTLEQLDPTIKTLNEQPNALIFNRNKKDPVPKGRR